MHFALRITQNAQQAAPTARATERQERQERPERPERQERPENVSVPSKEQQLRDELRQTIQAANAASRDAAQEAADAANQVRIVRGQLPGGGRNNIPGVIQVHPDFQNVIPPQAVEIAQGFFVMFAAIVIGWPLARAFGRRLERGGKPAEIGGAVTEQLQRIEQAVDAMAIEIERISESQRFMAKLQSSAVPEHAALPSSERR